MKESKMSDTQVQDAPQVEAPEVTEAPAPEAAAPEPTPDAVPPAPAPVAPAPRTGNAAWLSEDDRDKTIKLMNALRAAGYTRPELTRFTGFNDSTVWRAQKGRMHAHELQHWMDTVFEPFKDDKLPAPAASLRTPKPEVLQAKLAEVEAKLAAVHARIEDAVEQLTNPDVKTVKDLRALVTEVATSLSA